MFSIGHHSSDLCVEVDKNISIDFLWNDCLQMIDRGIQR